MGLFSSKKKLVTSLQVVRTSEDSAFMPAATQGVYSYLFDRAPDRSISKSIIEKILQASPFNYEKAFRYAEKGHYHYGRPHAEVARGSSLDIENGLFQKVADDLGFDVSELTKQYMIIGSPNLYHFFWQKLVDDYGYDTYSNELTGLSATVGFPCYLKTARVYVCPLTRKEAEDDPEYLQQLGRSVEWGYTPERAEDPSRPKITHAYDNDATYDYVKFRYVYEKITYPEPPEPEVEEPDPEGGEPDPVEGDPEEPEDPEETLEPEEPAPPPEPIIELIEVEEIIDFRDVVSYQGNAYLDLPLDENGDPIFEEDDGSEEGEELVKEFQYVMVSYKRTVQREFEIEPDPPEEDEEEEPAVEPTAELDEEDPELPPGPVTEIRDVEQIFYVSIPMDNVNQNYEDLLDYEQYSGQYYPNLYLRLYDQDIYMKPKTSPEFKTSKRLAKLLGIDFEDWAGSVLEQVGGDGEDVILTLGVPVNDNSAVVAEYFYRYFYSYFLAAQNPVGVDHDGWDKYLGQTLRIKDNSYQVTFAFDYISGGEVEQHLYGTGKYRKGNSKSIAGYTGPFYHWFRHQYSYTHYREIRIYNIHNDYMVRTHSHSRSGTSKELIVPLDRAAAKLITRPKDKELLFHKSSHLIVGVAKIIKKKWYQRGAFKALTFVIAVVASVITGGQSLTIWTVVFAAVKAIVINLIIQAVIYVTVRLLDSLGISGGIVQALAVVIAVVAAVAGYYDVTLWNVSADALMLVRNVAFKISQELYKLEYQRLMQEMMDFSREYEEKMQQLKDLRADLGLHDPEYMLMMRNMTAELILNLGEYPEDLYNRTTGLDITSTTTDMVYNFVEITTQPPTFQQLMQQAQQRLKGDDDAILI